MSELAFGSEFICIQSAGALPTGRYMGKIVNTVSKFKAKPTFHASRCITTIYPRSLVAETKNPFQSHDDCLDADTAT